VVVLGAGALWFVKYALDQNTEKSMQAELQNQKFQFLLKNVWMRQAQNPAQYKDEISALIRTYFKNIREIYSKYGRQQDLAAVWNHYEKGGAGAGTPLAVDINVDKTKSQNERASFKEAFDYSRDIYNMFMTGTFSPVFTETKESVRLDFYRIERVNAPDGGRVKWSFIMWGALPEMRYTGMEIKLYGAEDKHFGTMHSASSQPNLRVDDPSIWIPDFPPGATPGYYELPLVPAPVVKMDISFNVSGRSYFGSSVAWVYELKGLTVDPTWKLPPDAKWEAQAVEVPDEPKPEEPKAEPPPSKPSKKGKK
jgi:hypothetical protein